MIGGARSEQLIILSNTLSSPGNERFQITTNHLHRVVDLISFAQYQVFSTQCKLKLKNTMVRTADILYLKSR